MKKIHFLKSLFIGILTAAFVALPVAQFLQINPAPLAIGLIALPFTIKFCVTAYLGFMPRQATGALMAVQKETWVDYIIGNLFKDNSFLTKCYDESDSVLNGTVVHIPQAGARSAVVKNRSSFPGVAVRRTDTDITYALDSYTTDPRHITNAEAVEVSYDKMDSCMSEDVAGLSENIAEEILYKWTATLAGNILRTTGAADAVALSAGATGTRKALKASDLRAAQAKMNKDGIPTNDRYALIPEDMMTQLMADTTLTSSQLQLLIDIKEGKVGRLYGFEIMTRATVNVYDNAGTPVPKLPGAATAVSDNLAVLCWQKNQVTKAMGTVDFYENLKDALFYGDVYSTEVRMGGRQRRSNGLGVIAIVQIP